MLRPDLYPKAKLAAELDARLFAQGTELLKAEYASQSSMGVLLQMIDNDKLEKDISVVFLSPRRGGFGRGGRLARSCLWWPGWELARPQWDTAATCYAESWNMAATHCPESWNMAAA